MIKVCECFTSIQGESTRAGCPCFFIRLAGCNLRCFWCDSAYAYEQDGQPCSIEQLVCRAQDAGVSLVEITGGEPLMQPQTPALCAALLEDNFTVMIETNGSFDISVLPPACIRIIDVKCPDSGESDSFLLKNLDRLRSSDEMKFVLSSKADFDWALEFVGGYDLKNTCTIVFSPNLLKLAPKDLVAWILENKAPVRLGLQIHKFIWDPDRRGV